MNVNKSLWEESEEKIKSDKSFFRFALILIIIFISIVYLYTQIFFHVQVCGSSMVPTFVDEEVLLVKKTSKANKGDVIILTNVKSDSDIWLIKRLIAVEGDVVEIKDGNVFVNGEKLSEEYIKDKDSTFYPNVSVAFDTECYTIEVPEGQIFFLGDNRMVSRDGRSYGTVDKNCIIGVVPEYSIKIKGVSTFISEKLSFIRKFLNTNHKASE